MSPSTRARSRRATRLTTASTGSLEAMPESIVLHILARVPSSALARLACTCHDFNDLLVPTALPMRAELLGQRLCPRPGESILAALRFAETLAQRPVCTITADTCHTICVSPEGRCWSWGGHDQHVVVEAEEEGLVAHHEEEAPCWLLHLGVGRDTGHCVTRPAPIAGLPAGLRVVEVAAGYEHSLLRDVSGRVWSFGNGEHGRLGHLPLSSSSRPRCIEGLEHVAQVAAGGFQSLAVKDDGTAYSWGWGESGSTGHGERVHCHTPTLVEALRSIRIVQASAGSGHSLFVSAECDLYACGDFRFGKLGLGKVKEDALTPTHVVGKHGGLKVRHASAWHAHSLVVSTSGVLFAFGCGEGGRLGLGDEKDRWWPRRIEPSFFGRSPVKWAAAGEMHSCVLTESGRVYFFGDCSLGQNKYAPASFFTVRQLNPTAVKMALDVPLTGVAEVTVGDHHTIVRTDANELLSWGCGSCGQLGHGDRSTNPTPRRIAISGLSASPAK